MPTKSFVTKIDSEVLKELKKRAVDEGISMYKLLDKILREYLEKRSDDGAT